MIKLNYPKFWQKRGLLSTILLPLSILYRLLGLVRRLFYKPMRLPGFVICVGNMSVGGSGKTQVVKLLAQKLKSDNYKILIITKGYGGQVKGAKLVQDIDSASYVGDESKMLKRYAHVIAAKSIRSALPIIEELKPEIIIFDDGMQNPSFLKDFVILVIDAARNVGNGRIFPAGPLRQDIDTAIGKADIICLTGNQPCLNNSLLQTIALSRKKVFKSKIKVPNVLNLNINYYAFAGISNPDNFFNLLEDKGAALQVRKSFPDHHNYSRQEIIGMIEEAGKLNCRLITTLKDFVKIEDIIDDTGKIEYLDIDIQFDEEEQLFNIINEKIKTYI